MSVRRKLFLAMAAFIVGMGLVFAFVTQIVQRDTLDVMVEAASKHEIEALTDFFAEYYEEHNETWVGVEQVEVRTRVEKSGVRIDEDASFLLVTREEYDMYRAGDADYQSVKRLGVRSNVKVDGKTVGFLYYHTPDIEYMSKLRMGILASTKVLLLFGTVAFVLISLLVAFWLSRRLTSPLRLLIPAIDRLGKGEFGVQAPVVSRDEYGKVAEAFNGMSERLQRGEEARRNLVADVAHELRTPLTIIQGKLDLVQQQGEAVEPESLLPLQDELIRLTRLVGDLHQLSLAEARKLPMEKRPTDLAVLLRRIVERVEEDAESKGIEVTLACLAKMTSLNVGPNRITQVFLNLIINAVRYTPEGGRVRIVVDDAVEQNDSRRYTSKGERASIVVRNVNGQSDQSWNNHLRVTITDTGIGIAPEHLPYLFDRFYRTDHARDRNSGGMGLGLAIAKQFVLAHEGTIEVESEVGVGTQFVVVLHKESPLV